jgi:hypothetical protein
MRALCFMHTLNANFRAGTDLQTMVALVSMLRRNNAFLYLVLAACVTLEVVSCF